MGREAVRIASNASSRIPHLQNEMWSTEHAHLSARHEELVEMRQGTLLRQFRGGLVVAGVSIAIEGVTGAWIGKDGKAGVFMPHFFNYGLRNVIVVEPKVKDCRGR